MSADWYGIPVIAVGVVSSVIVTSLFSRLYWFSNPWQSAPYGPYAIPLFGIVLCMFLGTYFTEPRDDIAWDGHGTEQEWQEDEYRRSRAGGWYFRNFRYNSPEFTSLDSGDWGDSGEVIIILLLIALVIFLIVLSIFVPHFWVVAVCILLGLLLLITWREYRLDSVRTVPS